MVITFLCLIGTIFSLINGEYVAFIVLLLDTIAAYLFFQHRETIKNRYSHHKHQKNHKNVYKAATRVHISSSSNETLSYFAGCITNDQIKSRYRDLCKSLHPDSNNGDDTEFLKMHLEYDSLTKAI